MKLMREIPDELLPYDQYYVHLGDVMVKHRMIRQAVAQAKDESRKRRTPILISRGIGGEIIAVVDIDRTGKPIVRWSRPAYAAAANAAVAIFGFGFFVLGLVFFLVIVSRL